MPSRLAIDGAAYWCALAPTITSQPSAAAPTVSNWSEMRSGIDSRSRRCSSGVSVGIVPAPCAGMRISTPIGNASSPRLFAQSTKFGEMHIRTACPSFRSSSAKASAGCTSPRVPTAANSARMTFSLIQSVDAYAPAHRRHPPSDRRTGSWKGRGDRTVDRGYRRGTALCLCGSAQRQASPGSRNVIWTNPRTRHAGAPVYALVRPVGHSLLDASRTIDSANEIGKPSGSMHTASRIPSFA